MKIYLKIISTLLALFCVLALAAGCSDKKVKNDAAPEITSPEDVYLVSLYTFVSGGLSYYDYDEEGRLLSVTPVDPTTMQLANKDEGLSVVYSYSETGNISAISYLSCDMQLVFSDNGVATEANYSDGEGSVKMEFEYYDNGRVKKETIYTDGELFTVNEYNEIGMLASENMSLVGAATYRYTDSYSLAEYTLSYSEKLTYKIENNELGNPMAMTISSANGDQNMSWEYGENGLCSLYLEKNDNTQTRYQHSYTEKGKRILTESFFKSLDDPEYMLERTELSYDDSGAVASTVYSCFNPDGTLISKESFDYESGRCKKIVKDQYTAGVLDQKSVETLSYNALGLVTDSESTVFDGSGAIERRNLYFLEYDSEGRVARSVTENYAKGNVYDGKYVEEYEYSESGSYKVIFSEYDAEGNLENQVEDKIE